MQKISEIISKVIQLLLIILICMLVIFTFIQVLSRFILKMPIAWSEEIIRMNFVWLIFLGAAIGVKEKTHLALDIVTSSLNGKFKFYMNILVLIIMIVTSGVLFFAGLDYVIRNIDKTAVTMNVPSNIVYISAPISALIIIFFIVEKVVMEIKIFKKRSA